MIKKIVSLVFVISASGCSVMQSTPWDWLDDPESIRWVDIEIHSPDHVITFAIPDRLKRGGQHVHLWPDNPGSSGPLVIDVAQEYPARYRRWATFTWETWWGGFLKESGYDFSFNVAVQHKPDAPDFLGMSAEDWVQWRIFYWENYFSDPRMKPGDPVVEYFESYRIEVKSNANGMTFVFENSPTTKGDSVDYVVPIAEHHFLEFGFFVNRKRFNWMEDPEWHQRRWELVREIVDTIEISPRPGKF